MEDRRPSISSFCSQLRSSCSRLESSCASLRTAVDQSPILPSSNLDSFHSNLLERINSMSKAVETLEAMTIGTISFEELLGHCSELYKQNEMNMSALQEKLEQYGYVQEEFNEKNGPSSDEAQGICLPGSRGESIEDMFAKIADAQRALPSSCIGDDICRMQQSKLGQYHFLYPETLTVQDIGLSAAGLALIAEGGSSHVQDTGGHSSPPQELDTLLDVCVEDQQTGSKVDKHPSFTHDTPQVWDVSLEEYNSSPGWLKMQVSQEDLNAFLGEIQDIIQRKKNSQFQLGECVINMEDIQPLSVSGVKVKPCLVFLVRLGRLKTGHENGMTVYHVVQQ